MKFGRPAFDVRGQRLAQVVGVHVDALRERLDLERLRERRRSTRCSSSRLVIDSAIGGPAAIVSTISRAASSSSATGTTAFTSPSSNASAALTIFAVKASSFALWTPMRWRSSHDDAEVHAEAALREDRREPGAVGAPDQVGRERETEPGADADAVDLGDDRDRAVVDGEHDVAEHAHPVDHRARSAPGAPPSLAAVAAPA